MTISTELPKREKRLRKNLIAAIPKFPNNRTTKMEMEGKSLGNLLIDYIAWRLRLVGIRPRKVVGRKIANDELKSAALMQGANDFLEAVERGDDLTPYLSGKATKRGYTPQNNQSKGAVERWEDKDFLLNVMGTHHFHIGIGKTSSGIITRTDEVIFAWLDRNEFHILGIFDHSAFEVGGSSMMAERQRLYKTFDDYQSKNREPGVYISGGYGGLGIAMSGHPTIVVSLSMKLARIVHETEPKLDDPEFVSSLGFDPQKAKLEWHFNHLDFGLLDTKTNTFGILHYGFN